MKPPIIDSLTHISTGPDDVIGWGPGSWPRIFWP